jgi:3-oxoacyl-[acyl-carrier protein] reductase
MLLRQGPINTDLVLGLSKDWRDAKAAQLPLGHFGEPSDVAATVAFLASEDARIYVGQTLGPNSGDVML